MPDRHSPAEAEAVLRELLPDPSQRGKVTGYLREVWIHAHTHWPGKSSLSLFDQKLRLNLGMIEIFVVGQGWVGLVLDGEGAGPGEPAHYKSVPDGRFHTFTGEGFVKALPWIRPRHLALMEKAGRSPRHPTAMKAHSPGVVEFLGAKPPARHFLYYWKPGTIAAKPASAFAHIAGNQLRRVAPGDVVWVVTVNQGRLGLFLRFQVGAVVGMEEAQRRLETTGLWDAKVHLLAPDLDPQEVGWVDLQDQAHELRFQGKVDRLPPGFNPQHLQTLRLLDAESSRRVEEAWAGAVASGALPSPGGSPGPDPGGEPDDGEAEAFPEGRAVYVRHLQRERSSALVQRKKARFLKVHGRLFCEACGFDFQATYGPHLGAGFMECHHLRPVATLGPGDSTSLEDLALVCSNCHRMLHRARPWVLREGLRGLTSGKPAG